MRFALFLDLADAGFRKPKSRAESRTCAAPGHESESVRGAPRERRERGVPRRSPVGRGPRAVSSDATRVGGEMQAGEHFQNIQQAIFCHMAVQSQILESPCTFSDFENTKRQVSDAASKVTKLSVPRARDLRSSVSCMHSFCIETGASRQRARALCKGSPRATRPSFPAGEKNRRSRIASKAQT